MFAINYFETHVDPFLLQKELGLTSAIDSIGTLAIRVKDVYETMPKVRTTQRITQLQTFVLTALWGNRMDLSIWPVGGGDESNGSSEKASEKFSSILEAGQKMILSNEIEQVSSYVESLSDMPRVDIIVDNAGFELFCDLCLADFLIFSGLTRRVYLQLKAHPTFVSDAMTKDVLHTINFLKSARHDNGTVTPQSELGDRWESHIKEGKWVLSEQYFWVQPQAMWEMPEDIYRDLSMSSLIFVKGDANYRRMLGDRHWKFSTPFELVVSYFPAPVCALRTLKAELGCGMAEEATAKAASENSNWLVAGKYGVVQFCDTRKF